MKPLDLNKIEKIISENASEEELHDFDKMFRELPLETPDKEFTDNVVKSLRRAPSYSVNHFRLSLMALGVVVILCIFFILVYDNFTVPTLSDPLLQQWVPPVGESSSMLKQVLMIVNAVLMLVLLDKFAITPFFRKTSAH